MDKKEKIRKKEKTENKNRLFNKKNLMILIAIIIGYIAISFLANGNLLSRQFKSLIVPIGINIILAVSLNLTVGFLGELSLGHAGFMAIGAYAGSLFTLNAGINGPLGFIMAILVGGIFAGLFGYLVGVPALRLRGDYLAIVTLAFGEIIRSLINSFAFTGGALGISKIPRHSNYTWVYILLVMTILLIYNFVNSRYGRAIKSIRENYIAAESIGIRVSRYKTLAFTIAAFFAGVAGVLYSHNFSIIKPSDFGYNKSIEILVIVVLGGMGSIKGSVIAAIILTVLPEALRAVNEFRMLLYAIVLIVMMLLRSPDLREKIEGNDKLSNILKSMVKIKEGVKNGFIRSEKSGD